MIASCAADIYRTIVDFTDAGRAFAVATVLEAQGSTPREAATKAVIDSHGSIHGTVGGGAVEAETQRRAADAVRSGRPVVFEMDLEGTRAAARQPICGGSMRILVDPTAGDHRAAYGRAAGAERNRQRGVLLTSVRGTDGPRVAVRWVPENATLADLGFPAAEDVRAALARQTPRLVRGTAPDEKPVEVLIEPLVLPPLLVIAGGGHVGQALAVQADLVGFAVTVIDDRPEFTASSLFPPAVSTRCGDIARELAELPFDGDDIYVVIVTRGHQHDRAALAACVREPCTYLGMIGSRRKVAMVRRDILDAGEATEAQLDRVYAPIGLDIGAETVPEIAASIVGQLIAVRRKGTAPRISTQ